jgi:hypothetical protein
VGDPAIAGELLGFLVGEVAMLIFLVGELEVEALW